MKNVLEYLESTAKKYGEKKAVEDKTISLTYRELLTMAKRIGSRLGKEEVPKTPIAVLAEKGSDTLGALLGVVYAGCFYVPIQPKLPTERILQILETLSTPTLLTSKEGALWAQQAGYKGKVLLIEELKREVVQEKLLEEIRSRAKKEDLLYGIFTSGSTGTPKGIVVSHEAVLCFIGEFIEEFGITEKDCIGNQAPFDFDVSVKDIYSALATGATLVILPTEAFSMPKTLLDRLIEADVTILIWAVSALCMISSLRGFSYRIPVKIRQVLFSGEVMPSKQLRIWQQALPDAVFVNLYGPTEVTCNCTYYRVEREFSDEERIPIGTAFLQREVFLLDENRQQIRQAGQTGEICVAGKGLSAGYYHNPKENEKKFIEWEGKRTYCTGDLACYDEGGLLSFCGRKDFQIKHMGYRIELEELERVMTETAGVEKSCCIFDKKKQQIVAFYIGKVEHTIVRRHMKKKLPMPMLPGKIHRLEHFPLTLNGKTDRKCLLEQERRSEA